MPLFFVGIGEDQATREIELHDLQVEDPVFVLALRMSRPERLFTEVTTDELRSVLRSIQLPSIDRYPGTALADLMVASGERRAASGPIPAKIRPALP